MVTCCLQHLRGIDCAAATPRDAVTPLEGSQVTATARPSRPDLKALRTPLDTRHRLGFGAAGR